MSEEANDHDIVYPFVVVTSKGGPYDDNSYAAGWRMGMIDSELSSLPGSVDSLLYSVMRADMPQFDLVAMHHGFVIADSHECPESEGWIHVALTRDVKDVSDD